MLENQIIKIGKNIVTCTVYCVHMAGKYWTGMIQYNGRSVYVSKLAVATIWSDK